MPRSRIKIRARPALLWGLGLAFLLQMGLAFAIDRNFPEFRDPEYGIRVKRLYRRTVPVPERPLTVVMLGSSRTTAGFKASRLEKELTRQLQCPVVVFNFGITGAGPVIELLNLRRLLAQGIHPDLLLVEVMPPFLGGRLAQELQRLPVDRLWLDEVDFLKRYDQSALLSRAAWWESWAVPWYAHRYALVDFFRKNWLHSIDDSGGLATLDRRPSTEWYEKGMQRALQEYGEFFTAGQIGGPSCEALRDLLALCQQNQLPAVLVLTPEGSVFRSHYAIAAWRQVQTFLDGLSRQYGVSLINAREWIADDYFSDSHHLLTPGGIQFTDRLGKEVVLPLLRAMVKRG